MPQIILPIDANGPEHTVDCHDCGDRLDAEALSTHWDESGDTALCGICAQERIDDACEKGAEALRMLARLTRIYHGKPGTLPLSQFQAIVQEVFGMDPNQLELAAEVFESPTIPATLEETSDFADLADMATVDRLAREVHAAWRDGMLQQGREVAHERMTWETLTLEDQMLDASIAGRLYHAITRPAAPETAEA